MSDNPQKSAAYAHEIAPPPRALKWLIWTMIVLVVLGTDWRDRRCVRFSGVGAATLPSHPI
jgi:hypothetical protein